MTASNANLESKNARNSAKRVAKNTGFLYARMAITVFISLYITRLVIGSLGVEDFGVYNLVAGMVAMLVFLNAAMASATQRFMSYARGQKDNDKQKNIFNVSIVLHLIVAFLVITLIEVVGYFLFDGVLDIPVNRIEAAKFVFHFMVVSTFFTIISVPYDAVINARENMFFVAVIGVSEAFLKLGVAVYITFTDYDKLISFGLLMAGVAITVLLIKVVYCHINYIEVELHIKKYFNLTLFKEMGGFASWSFLGTSTSMLSFYGQGIVLNVFFGPIVNAAQAVAAQVNGQLSAFSTIMMQALNPMIVKSEGSGNRELMLKASLLGAKLSFFLLMMFCIPVMVEMPIIFNFWLGNTPEHTVVFCQLLLIKTLIYQLVLPLNTSIRAVGNIKDYEIIKSSISFMPLIVSYILFSLGFPAYIIYLVFIVEAIISSSITLYFCKKLCNLDIKIFVINTFLRCVISFVTVLALVNFVGFFIENDFIRLIVKTIFSMFTFVFVVFYIGFSKKEREVNTEVIKKISAKMKFKLLKNNV